MKGALLAVVLVSTLAMFPTTVQSQSPHKRGPHMDYLHIINCVDPDTEFYALELNQIDITDWPLTALWIRHWVEEGRIPSEISLSGYASVDAFEYDINIQKWPTGCDGVAEREGYSGTYTNVGLGKTWNMAHTRQRPSTSIGMEPLPYDPTATAEDALNGIAAPFGNGSDYDPDTDTWKVYFDEHCLWCTIAWGLRLAIAFTTDKDYIVSTILEGLGEKMITKAPRAHACFVDIANLTASNFIYNGPHGDVTIPSLIMDTDAAKAVELLEAAGFKDWNNDGKRNDPRKVSGPDKQYGTVDDVETSASNMDDLIFYIRLDDPNREVAGLKLAADLETLDVPVNEIDVDRAVCFRYVKIEYNYHLYTGGWVLPPDPHYLYHLFHSSMHWYPFGWSPNYPGFCHEINDCYLEWVKNGDKLFGYGGIFPGFRNATFLINKYVASIPLWSTDSAKAYRTGWEGVIGLDGGGIDNYWSFFNMRKAGTNTIRWGFKSSPETLSVITAEGMWDRKVLGLIYESLIVRNSYNLAKDEPMLATSWSTGIWDGDKLYVDFTLKNNVTWHDGTKLTAEDVKWGLEFIRDCGTGVAWNYMMASDIENVTVTTPGEGGSVRVYLTTGSAWALHLVGFLEFPNKRMWMNASAHFGWGYDPTKPEDQRWPDDAHRMMVRDYRPYVDDVYDPTSKTPNADGVVDLAQDGTGPWVFVGVTGVWGTIDLKAFRSHHLFQDEVEAYIEAAFHELGNVNYLGSTYTYPSTDRKVDYLDLSYVERAMFTNSTHYTHGTDWGQFNRDADFNDDNKVDTLDYVTAESNLNRRADDSGTEPNIVILDVVPSQTVVLQGSILSINVIVVNQGNWPETFNVGVFLSVYANTTFLGSQTVSCLPVRTATTLPFTWNTTGFLTGPYKITAIASKVPGEIDTKDNAYTFGMVKVQTENMHILSVFNYPAYSILLPFTINNTRSVSPGSCALNEGTYIVTMPPTIANNSVVYKFKKWEDNNTNPTRTINLNNDTNIIAYYEASTTPLPVIYASPIVTTAEPHIIFTINVKIADVTNLNSWEFKLYYDTRFMDTISAAEGPFLKTGGTTTFQIMELNDAYNATHGLVWLNCTLIGAPYGVNGNGTLATITFIATAHGNSILSLHETELSDPASASISHLKLQGVGLVRVKMLADINNDGIVDIVDVVLTALSFGTRIGEAPKPSGGLGYNPHADIMPEYGLIDIVDIVKIAIHFGEEDP